MCLFVGIKDSRNGLNTFSLRILFLHGLFLLPCKQNSKSTISNFNGKMSIFYFIFESVKLYSNTNFKILFSTSSIAFQWDLYTYINMIRIKEVIIKQNEAFPWQHTETFRVLHQYHIGARFIILFFLKFNIYEWLVDARIKVQYIILWHGPRKRRSQVPGYLNDISDISPLMTLKEKGGGRSHH